MSLRKAIEDAATDNSVAIEHQGSDLNALDELNADLSAGVVYQGSDLNYLELIIAAIPVEPSLAFLWDQAIGDHVDLSPPDYLEATIPMAGELEELREGLVIPAGAMTGANRYFDMSADGSVTVDLTYPDILPDSDSGTAWRVSFAIFMPGAEALCDSEVSQQHDGQFNCATAVFVAVEGDTVVPVVTGGTVEQMPSSITFRRAGANMEILFDTVVVRTFATTATRGAVSLTLTERAGVTLAGPTSLHAELSYTWPVVEAGD